MKKEIVYSMELSKKMKNNYPRLYEGGIGPRLMDSNDSR